MNTERDKFLTEYFGECWHEWEVIDPCDIGQVHWECKHCKLESWLLDGSYKQINRDFSTWQGFGWLWEKCQNQEWWILFKKSNANGWTYALDDTMVDPGRFADAIYEFLKERE